MQYYKFETPEQLRDDIKGFWYNKMDFGDTTSTFEIMPDGYAEIVFHFGSPCSIVYEGVLQPMPSPFIMGLLDQPVLLHAVHQLKVIGIKCYPWTVFDLLELSPGQHGVRIFEHPIAALQSSLAALVHAGRINDAVEVLKQYFLHQHPQAATDSTLSKAGVAMREANGTMPVKEVATAAHATVRTLERKFKESSGHTVKDVSALMRFEQVRNRLWSDPSSSLSQLAHELGYTDQSHLSKEFKRFSGTTPAAFARKAKKERHHFVAFLQS